MKLYAAHMNMAVLEALAFGAMTMSQFGELEDWNDRTFRHAFRRLRQAGLIESRMDRNATGRRVDVFSITADGRLQLLLWQRARMAPDERHPLVIQATEDDAGFRSAPDRYVDADGREACDVIREEMQMYEFGDAGYAAWCYGSARAYELRNGKKGTNDLEKARWFREMLAHVTTGAADPRSYRGTK